MHAKRMWSTASDGGSGRSRTTTIRALGFRPLPDQNGEPDARPYDEERDRPFSPTLPPLLRSSSSVSFAFAIVLTHEEVLAHLADCGAGIGYRIRPFGPRLPIGDGAILCCMARKSNARDSAGIRERETNFRNPVVDYQWRSLRIFGGCDGLNLSAEKRRTICSCQRRVGISFEIATFGAPWQSIVVRRILGLERQQDPSTVPS